MYTGESADFHVAAEGIRIGDWRLKPIYNIVEPVGESDSAIRVHGFFVFDADAVVDCNAPHCENLVAVYYTRPDERCLDWEAKTWPGKCIAGAVSSLKESMVIPDEQDPLWDVDCLGGANGGASAAYTRGFMAGDELGVVINALDDGLRSDFVALLKSSGYPVADPDFEKYGDDYLKGVLEHAADYFDRTIGRKFDPQTFHTNAVEHFAVSAEAFAMYCHLDPRTWPHLYPPLSPTVPPTIDPPHRCRPSRIEGELYPVGGACDCVTIGPWAAVCGTFHADFTGKVRVRVPWPPPLGTLVEFEAGIGGTLDICICMWARRCWSDTERIVTVVHADCTQTSEIESGPRMRFEHQNYTVATSQEECQRAAAPLEIPDNNEPCGLTYPTP